MRLRNSLLVLTMAAAPLPLRASNPTIIISDPPPPAVIVSDSFTFGADALGGGFFSFQNKSRSNWHELLVTATLPDLTAITCGPGPFQTCTISESPVTGGFFYDILFGPTVTGGILDNGAFSINLNNSGNDQNGVGDWGAGRDFSATANVPEPTPTLLFIVGGILVAGVFRYRHRTA